MISNFFLKKLLNLGGDYMNEEIESQNNEIIRIASSMQQAVMKIWCCQLTLIFTNVNILMIISNEKINS